MPTLLNGRSDKTEKIRVKIEERMETDVLSRKEDTAVCFRDEKYDKTFDA